MIRPAPHRRPARRSGEDDEHQEAEQKAKAAAEEADRWRAEERDACRDAGPCSVRRRRRRAGRERSRARARSAAKPAAAAPSVAKPQARPAAKVEVKAKTKPPATTARGGQAGRRRRPVGARVQLHQALHRNLQFLPRRAAHLAGAAAAVGDGGLWRAVAHLGAEFPEHGARQLRDVPVRQGNAVGLLEIIRRCNPG